MAQAGSVGVCARGEVEVDVTYRAREVGLRHCAQLQVMQSEVTASWSLVTRKKMARAKTGAGEAWLERCTRGSRHGSSWRQEGEWCSLADQQVSVSVACSSRVLSPQTRQTSEVRGAVR